MKRIHWSEMFKQMEAHGENGSAGRHQLRYVKKGTGEIVDVPGCTITSIHAKGSTVNILVDGDTHPKTIRKCLVIEFNGMQVYI